MGSKLEQQERERKFLKTRTFLRGEELLYFVLIKTVFGTIHFTKEQGSGYPFGFFD
jgi:hypothetical protein